MPRFGFAYRPFDNDRTAIRGGVGYYNINTDNSPEVHKEYRAEAYSVLADYTFTPAFDAYAAIMAMRYAGVGLQKKAPILAYSSNAMYGVGLRFKF